MLTSILMYHHFRPLDSFPVPCRLSLSTSFSPSIYPKNPSAATGSKSRVMRPRLSSTDLPSNSNATCYFVTNQCRLRNKRQEPCLICSSVSLDIALSQISSAWLQFSVVAARLKTFRSLRVSTSTFTPSVMTRFKALLSIMFASAPLSTNISSFNLSSKYRPQTS